MRHLVLLTGLAALLALPAAAQEIPDSCKPKIAGVALALADEADSAQLQCDIDRAAIYANRSQALFNFNDEPLVRIVDTGVSLSGAVYVYDVTETDGVMMLDARSVPADMASANRVPVCRLRIMLSDQVTSRISIALLEAASPDVPGYAERVEVVVNPDGSRRSVLLIDSHDVVTTVQTADGERAFSRNAAQTDRIGTLNQTIIGVANISDGWSCLSD
ncbi:MAG: hypothetical protein R3C13_03175 [Hyphomonas sp.]|uniref:hypothetical protein n=1 Tax=Hyphomonas sp. TaxID=87 RepID=UPI003527AC91